MSPQDLPQGIENDREFRKAGVVWRYGEKNAPANRRNADRARGGDCQVFKFVMHAGIRDAYFSDDIEF